METTHHRILIIDDEKQIADGIRRFLQMDNYDAVSTYDAEEGMASLKRRPAGIVITDIKMPGIDGIQLLEQIRQSYPGTDVILISGHGDLDDAVRALRLGAFDYLRKPVNYEELKIVVERALERRQAERRFRDVQEQLYHAHKLDAIGTLAGGVAHEFNNIMTGVIGYCEMALRKQDDHALVEKALSNSHRAAMRAAEIARNLLRFARREEQKTRLLDINAIIGDTVSLVGRDFQAEKITLQTDLSPLPQIEAGSAHLQQVILNLLVNARQAVRGNERSGSIVLRTRVEDERVVIQVQDNGGGIPNDIKPFVFEPFFTTWGVLGGGAEHGATGLGLSVVDGIVRSLGGELALDDTSGGGTTISIYLPVPKDQELASRRILLCDDESDVRRIMRTVLEHAGFEVAEASSGSQALELIRGSSFGVLFVDERMPGISGLEVIRGLREINPDLPVVMVTAVASHELAEKAVLAGARECVFKPVNTERLIFLASKYTGRIMTRVEEGEPIPRVNPSTKSILVLEGHPTVREIYQMILQKEGFRVEATATLSEALDCTERQYYDLIILDASPVDTSYDQCVTRIRSNNPYTPILVSAGHATPEILSAGQRVGACKVLEKPINPSVFLGEVHRYLAMYEENGPVRKR